MYKNLTFPKNRKSKTAKDTLALTPGGRGIVFPLTLGHFAWYHNLEFP